MPRATMADIARDCGVSRSTVSRVLSGQADRYRISSSTAGKIESSARRLGYRPNTVARSLRTRSTRTLGLLVSDISNPFFGQIAWAVERAAEAEGFTLIVCNSAEEQAREKSYIEELRSRQVDGLIISPVQEEHAHLSKLLDDGFPFVLLDRYLPELDCDCVVCDNVEGARRLTEAVIELGHRRVGFIGGRPAATTSQDRFLGYWQAVTDGNADADRTLMRERDFTRDAGRWGMRELLAADDPPTAVVAANNNLMIGALEELIEHERKGADPVLVAGFDVVPFLKFLGRPVLCVSQPEAKLGEEAARMVIGRIGGSRSAPEQVVLKQEILRFNLPS